MSVFKDKHVEHVDRFHEALANYEHWREIIENDGWTDDNGVTIGEYYGLMCGYANTERELFDMTTIWDEINDYEKEKGLPLFKSNFKAKKSS